MFVSAVLFAADCHPAWLHGAYHYREDLSMQKSAASLIWCCMQPSEACLLARRPGRKLLLKGLCMSLLSLQSCPQPLAASAAGICILLCPHSNCTSTPASIRGAVHSYGTAGHLPISSSKVSRFRFRVSGKQPSNQTCRLTGHWTVTSKVGMEKVKGRGCERNLC